MAFNYGFQLWFSTMAFNYGFQLWLSTMVFNYGFYLGQANPHAENLGLKMRPLNPLGEEIAVDTFLQFP